jgi:hypothetical protein
MPEDLIKSLLSKKQALNPELSRYLRPGPLGPALFHPLCYQILYTEALNCIINTSFKKKKEAQRKALKGKKWATYVFLYERPYRLQGFVEIKDRLRDCEYWALLGSIWTDSDNIWQNFDLWCVLLSSDRAYEKRFTGKAYRGFFDNLPETIVIYRGFQPGQNDKGLSFSLSKKKAQWFATRYSKLGSVMKLTVLKKHLLGYTNCRDEQEVILRPQYLKLIKEAV